MASAAADLCEVRGWQLIAINVRTNHAHFVVNAPVAPEPLLNMLKATATRALRRAGPLGPSARAWSRHGSTVYLWNDRDVEDASAYVLFGQGDDLK